MFPKKVVDMVNDCANLDYERGCVIMEMPSEYATIDTPMYTDADWARILKWSRTYVARLARAGALTPQRHTLGGRRLYEPGYVEWAKVNVPEIARRMSVLALE